MKLGRLLARLQLKLAQAWCGVRDHDVLLHVDGGRMFLRCTSCGHESPGWQIHEPRFLNLRHVRARRTPFRWPWQVRRVA